ncbi:MAG: phosphocholine cytidylyltransferase family protein [Spirochaetes bacterium]|nr:phosphocholine cytidylyltransferase family protein [Spirochaetota bacterium]
MVKTAVILAAGRGTRLKELGTEIPKGFLQLGSRPIIEESLEKLYASGIERVIIVTGHIAEKYEELAARSSGRVVTVHNDQYADSGSLYSLYLAGNALQQLEVNHPSPSESASFTDTNSEGFLLLESDLVYESRALKALQEDPRPDLILVSGRTDSGDEVWVGTEGETLRALSKDRSKLAVPILGELVGISKISMPLYARLSEVAERLFEKTLHVEYETGLTETARDYPIPCLLIPDLVWAEIDDANHLERARGLYGRLGS